MKRRPLLRKPMEQRGRLSIPAGRADTRSQLGTRAAPRANGSPRSQSRCSPDGIGGDSHQPAILRAHTAPSRAVNVSSRTTRASTAGVSVRDHGCGIVAVPARWLAAWIAQASSTLRAAIVADRWRAVVPWVDRARGTVHAYHTFTARLVGLAAANPKAGTGDGRGRIWTGPGSRGPLEADADELPVGRNTSGTRFWYAA